MTDRTVTGHGSGSTLAPRPIGLRPPVATFHEDGPLPRRAAAARSADDDVRARAGTAAMTPARD